MFDKLRSVVKLQGYEKNITTQMNHAKRMNRMKKRKFCLFIILAMFVFPNFSVVAGVAEIGKSFTLVEKAKSACTIVVGEEASMIEKYAANELQRYMRGISGAVLPIVKDNQEITGNKVLIGRNRLTGTLHIDTGPLGEEGFMIRRMDENLILTGNSDLATLYSVYDLLERIGCRWFTPKEEIIPKLENVKIEEINVIEKPDFQIRWVESYWLDRLSPSERNWCVKNKLNYELAEVEGQKIGHIRRAVGAPAASAIAHTFYLLLPYDEYFASHPEYYALIKGERKKLEPEVMQYCTSNPSVAKEVAKNLIKIFSENPQMRSYPLSPGDGGSFCQCDNCRALDDPSRPDDMSRRLMIFYNEVAKLVYDVDPSKTIDVTAYYVYTRAPQDVKPYKNIRVMLSHYELCHAHAISDPNCKANQKFKQILEEWASIANNRVWLFEYYWKVNWMGPAWPISRSIRKDIPYLKRLGLEGLFTQCSNTWVVEGQLYYLTAKLLWDVEADVDAILGDYYSKFYGRAGSTVKSIFDTLETAMSGSRICIPGDGYLFAHKVFTPEVIGKCKEYLKTAETLAEDAIIRERVRRLGVLVDYTDNFTAARRLEEASGSAIKENERRELLSRAASHWTKAIALARANPDSIWLNEVLGFYDDIEKAIKGDLSGEIYRIQRE